MCKEVRGCSMSTLRQPVQHNNSDRQRVLVENPRVFVDFHNADAQGCLCLNCIGTIEDLSAKEIELQAGQHLILYSEDLEVDGIVKYSQSENLWVVVIDWDEIREVEESSAQQKLFEPDEAKGDLSANLAFMAAIPDGHNPSTSVCPVRSL